MAQIQGLDVLKSSLAEAATIDIQGSEDYAASTARWNAKGAPAPGAVVNITSEADVEATVKWATQNKVPFVAQSGGHAWASWFKIDSSGIVINMRGLNSVEVDVAKGEAVIGGGALVGEVMTAAAKAEAHVMIGTCNSVGAISSVTGGGIGYLMGKYSCAADNILSARIVLASTGKATDVSATSHPDLFWAIRGAATNFGLVTALTIRAYPPLNGGHHFQALWAFPPTRLADVVAAAQRLDLRDDMSLNVIFTRVPPDNAAVVAVSVWFAGGVEEARRAFGVFLDLDPVVVAEGMVPYERLNDGVDQWCGKGGFKLGYSISCDNVDVPGIQDAWDAYVDFSAKPTAGLTLVNFEMYSTDRARSVPVDATAVGPAVRTKRFHVFLGAVYTDAALHGAADEVGRKFRSLMQEGNGGGEHSVYPNFATGDESTEQLYGTGERLERLKALKKQYDPESLFSQHLPIY